MEYYNWIDEQIYSELERNGLIRFNEMLRIINKLRPKGSKKVVRPLLSAHLKKMVKQNILQKDETEKGYTGSYRFTESAKILRKIGAFEGVTNERNGYNFDEAKNPKRVLKKILRKTLYAKAIGITKIVEQTISKSGTVTVHKIRHDESFLNKDIIDNQPVNSTNMIFSSHVKIKDEDVENIIHACDERLRMDEPFTMAEFHKKRKIIKHYFTICCEISGYVRLILESTRTHIRDLNNAELAWYSETMGQDKLINFLEYETKERKNEVKEILQKRPELKTKYLDEVKRRISIIDQLIITRQKELDNLLKDMDEKFQSVCNLINDLSYPEFMKDSHTKIYQIPKDSTM